MGGFANVPRLIRGFGLDPAPILAAAGLASDALDEPEGRVSYASLAHVLSEAAARADCPHFGLLVGGEWWLADLGTFGELIVHSPTAGQGVEEYVVSHFLVSTGGGVFLLRREGIADLGYAIHAALSLSPAPLYDVALAAALNVMRELFGEEWAPSEVLLTRAPPADTAPYRQRFRAPVRFNSEFCALRFPSGCLEKPNAGADPARLQGARDQVIASADAPVVQLVSRALRRLLILGMGSGDEVAQALAMHRRTLNRRLSAEGTTFQQVLDRVRFAVAKEFLEDSKVSIPGIAENLGYADYVSFTRAFRRWTGTTPGAWRKSPR